MADQGRSLVPDLGVMFWVLHSAIWVLHFAIWGGPKMVRFDVMISEVISEIKNVQKCKIKMSGDEIPEKKWFWILGKRRLNDSRICLKHAQTPKSGKMAKITKNGKKGVANWSGPDTTTSQKVVQK